MLPLGGNSFLFRRVLVCRKAKTVTKVFSLVKNGNKSTNVSIHLKKDRKKWLKAVCTAVFIEKAYKVELCNKAVNCLCDTKLLFSTSAITRLKAKNLPKSKSVHPHFNP